MDHINEFAIDKNVLNWLNFVSWVELGLIMYGIKSKKNTCKYLKHVSV